MSDYFAVDLNKSDYDVDAAPLLRTSSKCNESIQFCKKIFNSFIKLGRSVSREPLTSKPNAVPAVAIEKSGGLANRFVLMLLMLWYLFSALTLYTNKYIITSRQIDPTIIG